MNNPPATPARPPTDLLPACISAFELARMLNCSVRHIERLDASCRMPAPIRLGRAKRWRLDEIRAWLAAGCPDRRTWETRRSADRGAGR